MDHVLRDAQGAHHVRSTDVTSECVTRLSDDWFGGDASVQVRRTGDETVKAFALVTGSLAILSSLSAIVRSRTRLVRAVRRATH